MEIIPNKYKVGETVCAKVNPQVKLVVRRYVSNIYYCRFPDEPSRKEMVLFEREILDTTTPPTN